VWVCGVCGGGVEEKNAAAVPKEMTFPLIPLSLPVQKKLFFHSTKVNRKMIVFVGAIFVCSKSHLVLSSSLTFLGTSELTSLGLISV
jgi:hypothetical protein